MSDIQSIGNIEFRVVYSGRRTLGINVLPDASVVVRVPYRTPVKTINRIVEEKSAWIIRHRDNFRNHDHKRPVKSFKNGSAHLYRGNACTLIIGEARRPNITFDESSIKIVLDKPDDEQAVKKLLFKGYKNEAIAMLPLLFNNILKKHSDQDFKPTGLVVRSMKRRWGSCSNKGKITLSSELVKLEERFIEYVILHELCHLKHHNHGPEYYRLLATLLPDWKNVRNEMKMVLV
jgi:hypothetical protein